MRNGAGVQGELRGAPPASECEEVLPPGCGEGGSAGRLGTPRARCRQCGEGTLVWGNVVFGVTHTEHEEPVGDTGLELVKGRKGQLQPPKGL